MEFSPWGWESIICCRDNSMAAMPGLTSAALFLVVTPVSLKGKAKTQVQRTKMFQKPLEYELSEEGVTVRQGEREVTNKWEDFSRRAQHKNCALLIRYVTIMRVLIFPSKSM